MPIYEYRSTGEFNCSFCSKGFERLAKISDSVLTQCPECGNKIKRVLSAPNLSKPSPSLERSNLEKHGFTQYRKSSKGVYEKTAGTGPNVISSDSD
jgi:putative FmdB family regulatory protein